MSFTNYHTHTGLCRHALGAPDDYALNAFVSGCTCLGFSDHVPYPDNRFGLRMSWEELPEYIDRVRSVQCAYHGRMEVLLGLESEYLPEYAGVYEALLTRYGIDYLILGQHFFRGPDGDVWNTYGLPDSDCLTAYARSVRDALSTGLFRCAAHPDLVGINGLPWDDGTRRAYDIILDAAEDAAVPLELNANGIRRGPVSYPDGTRYSYPDERFFALVSSRKLPVIVGSDCHSPQDVCDRAVQTAYQLAVDWKLNRVDSLSEPA